MGRLATMKFFLSSSNLNYPPLIYMSKKKSCLSVVATQSWSYVIVWPAEFVVLKTALFTQKEWTFLFRVWMVFISEPESWTIYTLFAVSTAIILERGRYFTISILAELLFPPSFYGSKVCYRHIRYCYSYLLSLEVSHYIIWVYVSFFGTNDHNTVYTSMKVKKCYHGHQ